MITKISNKIYIVLTIFLISLIGACTDEEYQLGDLTTPTDLTITTEIVGQDISNPDGDGSGLVKITAKANDAMYYQIAYNLVSNLTPNLTYDQLENGAVTKKFEESGVNTYRITVIAYGKGGVSTIGTKDITVRSDFNMDSDIITKLTNDSSKTWVVDKSVAGHLIVGPWADPSTIWWTASVNEKVDCCNCFYTATYTFTRTVTNTFTLQVTAPDGIFANADVNNLGISGSGESCYSYTPPVAKDISFGYAPAMGLPSMIDSTTGYKMTVAGVDGFIGYGSCSNTYEIIYITDTTMMLRSQGVNTANLWYLKLVAVQ